jgi:hypothetical protein
MTNKSGTQFSNFPSRVDGIEEFGNYINDAYERYANVNN